MLITLRSLTVSSTAACAPSPAAEENVSRAAGSASTADIQHGANSNGHREPEKHGKSSLPKPRGYSTNFGWFLNRWRPWMP
jgi:hypothetical protein